MGKLEDTFNLPDVIEDFEKKISSKFSDEDEVFQKMNGVIKEFEGAVTDVSMAEMVNLKEFDAEMNEISEKTLQEFEDLMTLGKDVESRHAGDIFSAAAQMAKIAMDARTNKTNAKLKIIELSIRKQRNDLLAQKQNHEMSDDPGENDGQTMTRDDILALAEQLSKKS
jgi:hypothetical protein